MLLRIKRCHMQIISRSATRRKAASMPVCSRCAAAFAVLKAVSAAWKLSAVAAPNGEILRRYFSGSVFDVYMLLCELLVQSRKYVDK
ncbi:hypothetical protein Pint_29930 [Pistacia integerrima]|uniref:Uncharacterized protein n=1 Tax=Pistacia integerrima TaxID=434235 RepID=A0ACC0X3C8_9ROSI|nr:hypothetical protein Pint_29930 [Pistacia integerrima]